VSGADASISGGGAADPRGGRLATLAAHLGVPLPPFEGPLVAFQLDGHRGAEDPVFLGGDLHAVHPAAGGPAPAADRDPSLDFATISLSDREREPLDVPAAEGIWCTRLEGERLLLAPYFSLTDTDGRARAWLLLPPPRLMVGIAHFWLPAVGPPEERRAGSGGPSDHPPRP
jgi:hypothetical protein